MSQASLTTPAEPQMTLLVIDDEAEIVKALKRQFRKVYRVLVAQGAEEALGVMEEHAVQVIISDQRMPGMTGTEFYSRVREEYPDAMRLLLTGYADINAVVAAINDGNVFRYITKPWDPLEVDTIVREAFERYALLVEQKRLLQELREANERLEERVRRRTAELGEVNRHLVDLNDQKNEFLTMAAHDLRSPLQVVRGFASLVRQSELSAEKRDECLERIERSSKKMLVLIDSLLDIQKIEMGKVAIRLAPVNLDDFLHEVMSMNSALAESKGLTLRCDRGDDLPATARFDSVRIDQVLTNLLANAIKFSHPGTTVTLTVSCGPSDLTFAVRDQGLGIPSEALPEVFGAFKTTSTTGTGGEAGSGHGLAICKRIVTDHGGEITAESSLSEGSCFTVKIPQ